MFEQNFKKKIEKYLNEIKKEFENESVDFEFFSQKVRGPCLTKHCAVASTCSCYVVHL